MNPVGFIFHNNFNDLFENVVEQRRLALRYRYIRDHTNPYEIPNEKFIKLFRLNKHLVQDLVNELQEFNHDVGERMDKIPFFLQVFVCLNFYGHGSYQTAVGQDLNLAISQPMVSRFINKISNIFAVHLLPTYVKFPTTQPEVDRVKNGFLNNLNFPNTIGAIDCSHIAIGTPKINDPFMPAISYLNRKGFYSINMQAISDSAMVILNVNARYPGATHDSAIWETSTINAYLRRKFQNGDRNIWLIGDSGYALQPWLMTPINNAPPNSPEAVYTNRHSSARNVIERCFGVLKGRFRCLKKTRVLYYDHATAGRIIYACVVLHNICRKYNLPDIEEEDDEDDDNDDNDPDNNIVQDLNILAEGRLVRRRLVQAIANNA